MKQKRGIRVVTTALLTILVASQAFFLAPQITKADGGGAPGDTILPTDIPDLLNRYEGQALADTGNKYSNDLLGYYHANIENKTLANPTRFPAYFGGTDADVYKKVYSDTYDAVGKIDSDWWAGFFNDYIFLADYSKKNFTYDSSLAVDTFNTRLARAQGEVVTSAIQVIRVWAGLQILSDFDKYEPADVVAATQKSLDGLAGGLVTGLTGISTGAGASAYAAMKNDLDLPGSPSSQTKSIWKATSLTQAVESTGTLTKAGTAPYSSIENFYIDFQTLANPIMSMSPLPTDPTTALTQIATDQQLLIQAAKTADSATGLTNPNTGQCGTSASVLGEPVKAIGQALCGLVITVAQFNASLVQTAGNVLAAMLSLPGGGSTTTGLAAYIPAAIQPQGILDNLNAIPFVADTIILVNRILGFLIIFALLVIALANILQININIYAIKKAVPALVIGYVLALGAPFATKVCIEFSNYLAAAVMSPKLNGNTTVNISTLVNQMSYVHSTSGNSGDPSQLNFTDAAGGVNMGGVFQQAILNMVTLIAAVLMFILAFLLVIRALIFIVLLPLAPVAFFGITFEPLNAFWKKWWKTTESWLFMNTVAAFWLWLMFKLVTIGNNSVAGSTNGNTTTSNATVLLSGIVAYVAGIVCLWLAVTTPFKMAGEAKAIFSKAEKLVNTGKDKAIHAAGAPGRFLKDEASMRFGRLQPYQAAKRKIADLTEERKKNVEYGQKGLNYKSIKKDAHKLADLAKQESELESIGTALQKREEDIERIEADRITHAGNALKMAELDLELQKALNEEAELQAREDEVSRDIRTGERKLTLGSKSNRKQIRRDMFHHKHEEIFKEEEEILKNSTQARVAQWDSSYKKLDGEKRDLTASKDHVGYLAKSELDKAYREGFDGHENDPDLKRDRQFNAARVEALKKMDEDNADEDKIASSVEYLYALKDNTGDIQSLTDEEKEVAKKQGRAISSAVDEEAKKDKGYDSGESIQSNIINGIDIPAADRKDAFDAVSSIARAYLDSTTGVNVENRTKIQDAIGNIRGKVAGTPYHAAAQAAYTALGNPTLRDNDIKKIVNTFKSSNLGKRLKEISKDPHEAMINAKLKEL